MAVQDGSGLGAWPCKFLQPCMERHSLGIIAKPFPECRSQRFKLGTGWKVPPFHRFLFFLINNPKHCQWLVPSSVWQVPPSLAKYPRENAALEPTQYTNTQGPKSLSGGKLWHSPEFSENIFPTIYTIGIDWEWGIPLVLGDLSVTQKTYQWETTFLGPALWFHLKYISI